MAKLIMDMNLKTKLIITWTMTLGVLHSKA